MNYLTPEQWVALVVILGITISMTEIGKRLLRRYQPDLHRDSWVPRALSVIVGMAVGFNVWPPGGMIEPIWAGLFVGSTAPVLYKAMIALIAKRYPGVAAAITGNKTDSG